MAKQSTPQKEKQQVAAPPKQQAQVTPFIFDKSNYFIMIAGVAVIALGFILMSGGATADPKVFPKEELYSFRRITLAPLIVMVGFAIEIFAILKRPKN